MAEGDSMRSVLCAVSAHESELLDWMLDNGVSASWIADALTDSGHPVGQSTVKAWRRRVNRERVTGAGESSVLTQRLEAKRAEIEDAAIKANTPKVLTIDIERVPGIYRRTFWGKKVHTHYLRHEEVESWPRTICWAAKWLGDDELLFSSEWDGSNEEMIRAAHAIIDEADVIVSFNGQRFDIPKLRTEWTLLGLPDPSPWRNVDLMRVARDRLGFEDNTLDSLCQRFGVESKSDKYNPAVAFAACEGDLPSQLRLRQYNCGDIIATEALYERMRGLGLISGHPPMAAGYALHCQACQSRNVQPTGKTFAPGQAIAYPVYRCADCGTTWRSYRGERVSHLRGVKA